MKDLKEKTIHKEYKFYGVVVNLRTDDAETADGMKVKREVVEHPGGVAIAMEDEEGRFWLVRQWRYAQERALLEFPAGKKETGEDPLTTGMREIAEETGYAGKDFVYLGELVPTGAYDSEVIHAYYTVQGEYLGQHLDADENLNLEKYTLDELTEMIMNGEIIDAKTIAMTFMIKERKRRQHG